MLEEDLRGSEKRLSWMDYIHGTFVWIWGLLRLGRRESEDGKEVLIVEGSGFCDFGFLMSLMDVMLKENTSSGFGFRNCMKEWHAMER